MKKKKGFSLIEVLVVLGIIGLFTGLMTPKISRYMAVGKETKALSTLETLRAASEIYYFSTGEALGSANLGDTNNNLTKAHLDKLQDYVSNGYENLLGDAKSDTDIIYQEIGGSRGEVEGELTEDITYGGKIAYTFKGPNGESSDGIKIWIETQGDVKAYNIKGDKWTNL